MKISIVVAVADNGVIGDGAEIPWHIEGEQSLFKAVSYHHRVLMGRKTWESIRRPLPGRDIIVVSRNPSYKAPGCLVCTSLEEALAVGCDGGERLMVAGGAAIFRETLAFADTLHITHVHTQAAGDVFMPEIPQGFSPVFSQDYPAEIPYTYTIYTKGE